MLATQREFLWYEYKLTTVCCSCAGINYNRRLGQCDVFDAIDEASDVNEHVDFYKNLCVVKEEDSSVSAAANVPTNTHRVSGTVTNKDNSRSHLSASKKVVVITEVLVIMLVVIGQATYQREGEPSCSRSPCSSWSSSRSTC